jgi:UDP-galactopyranose mutase
MSKQSEYPQLLVFSHLRWENLPQRSQELIQRESRQRKIYLFELPVFGTTELPYLQLKEIDQNIQLVIPYLPKLIHPENVNAFMRDLVDDLIFEEQVFNYSLWYFDSMAVNFTDHLEPVSMQFVSLEDTPQRHGPTYAQYAAQEVSMSGAI